MAPNFNDPQHPDVQQLAQSTPDQVSPEAAQAALQALHDQVPPDQLRPMLAAYYASLPPDQLQAQIAQLQQELAQKQNPETQQVVAQVDPNNPTPQQAVELHAHAHEFHPDTVQKVVIAGAGTAAVAGLAIFAARHFAGNH